MTGRAQRDSADVVAGAGSLVPGITKGIPGVQTMSDRRLHALMAPPSRDGSVGAPSLPRTMQQHVDDLALTRARAEHDVEARARHRHHARGALTARERIDLLLDPGSFVEIDMFVRHRARGFGIERTRPAGDGVVTGWGTVNGRTVVVFAHDARIFGGSLGEMFAAKVHKAIDLAESAGVPIIGLNDGGGARIQEGVDALAGFGGIFARTVRVSGVIPQISVILGSCAGGAVYAPSLTDFVFMVENSSNMFITGPDVVRAVTGEDVSQDELGGARVHAQRSGVASFTNSDERACLDDVRYLLSFLPSNNAGQPPEFAATDDPDRRCELLAHIVPAAERTPYDIRQVLADIVDEGEYLEVHEAWARNIVCAFARLDGRAVGVVGNQPLVLAGALDIDAAEKAARFVRTCDAFNVPLVTLVDVPGFLPGTAQEHNGIIRRGAKLLYAYCEATVPRIQVVLRKAFGGAYIVMDSKSIGADFSFAWPTNQIAVMGAVGAANIIFRCELAAAADPDRRRDELAAEYAGTVLHPYAAAERGLVDDVIDPADTRRVLIRALDVVRAKRAAQPARKHGNGPM